jgi:hypothetical protein
METETTLLLDLDERNLAHFLSALALAGLAGRVEGNGRESRRCWWPEPGHFAIQTKHPCDEFRMLLFAKAHAFLKAMEWHPGLGGVERGAIVSGEEMGVNPFVPLKGDGDERPLLRAFSAKVIPQNVLPQQKAELRAPSECPAWLNQLASGAGRQVKDGVSSWGYDYRVNIHASDAGISSDAEGSGRLDPIFPAIELLSLAGASFFASAHAWTSESGKLCVTAWSKPLLLSLAALASSGRVHGLPSRSLTFLPRGGAHGKGGSFRFFPPATIQSSTP